MKVKIHTNVVNRPEFIPLQYQSLNHFLKDDFELIVFITTMNSKLKTIIKSVCEKLNLKYFALDFKKYKISKKIENILKYFEWLRDRMIFTIPWIFYAERRHPSARHSISIQWEFHNIIKYYKNNISCIIDSDMFLIDNFSIEEYLKGYDIAATKNRSRHLKYLRPGIMFFNMNTLPAKDDMNFNCGTIDGQPVDSCGYLHYWIKNNPDLKIRNILHTDEIYSKNNNLHCLPKEILEIYEDDFKFEIYEKSFLHYGRGSNWDNDLINYHKRKTKVLRRFLKGRFENKINIPDYDYIYKYKHW